MPKLVETRGAAAAAATEAQPFMANAHGTLRSETRESAAGNGMPMGNATAAQTSAAGSKERGMKRKASGARSTTQSAARRKGRPRRSPLRLPRPEPMRNPPSLSRLCLPVSDYKEAWT